MGTQAPATPLAVAPVAGRYRPLRELGRGASGRVLLAEDASEPGRQVALKMVPAQHAARLRWEFERLRSLAHPGVCAAFELLPVSDAQGGGATLVCEFIDGPSAERSLREGPGSAAASVRDRLRRVLDIGRQVASALAAIHAEGLVHGDVKPDNIVVAPDRGAVLVDLGLCRQPGWDAVLSGTPGYLAPELFAGELRFESDHYAFGVALLRLLQAGAGHPPSVVPASGNRATWAPTPPPALPEHLPTDVADLLSALVRSEPDTRPRSMEEIAVRLDALAVEQGATPGDTANTSGRPAAYRARRMLALPHVGADGPRAELAARLNVAGITWVVGSDGSGRSRLVREASARVQRDCAQAGTAAPSYQLAGEAPSGAGHDRIWHVMADAAPDVGAMRRQVAAAEVAGDRLAVVVEASNAPAGEVTVETGPLSRESVRLLLEHALPDAQVTEALVDAGLALGGGLAGRLCRALSVGAAAERELSRPGVLASLSASIDDVGADAGDAGAEAAGLAQAAPSELRPLVDALALAGGSVATAALSAPAALVASARTLGIVSLGSDGRVTLRPDLVVLARSACHGRPAAAHAWLDEAQLDPFARAMLALSVTDCAAAVRHAQAAVAEARAAGEPERALTMAGALRADVDRLQVSGEAAVATGPATWEPLTALLDGACVDALRASGRYVDGLSQAAQLGVAAGPAGALVVADLRRLTGDLDGAEGQLAGLAADADADTPPLIAAEAQALRARIAFDRGEHDRARQLATSAQALCHAAAVSTARAVEVQAMCDVVAGAPEAAAERLYRALDELPSEDEGFSGRRTRARLLSVLGWAERQRARVDVARHHYQRAVELADAAGERHAAASAMVNVGTMQLEAGELGSAMGALLQGAQRLCLLARDADQWRALYNLALARQLTGDLEGAAFSCQQALAAAGRADAADGVPIAASLAAELALGSGRLGAARSWLASLQEAGAITAADRARPSQVVVFGRAVEVALGLDDPATAGAALDALAAAVGSDGGDVASAELALGRLRLMLGRATPPAEVAEGARVAVATAEKTRGFGARLRARLVAARAWNEAGDAHAAQDCLAHARGLLDAAARSLSRDARARLRRVPAYLPAFEVRPAKAPELDARDRPGRDAVEPLSSELMRVARGVVGERRLSSLHERIVEGALDLTTAQRGYLVMRDRSGQLRVRASRGSAEEDALTSAALSSSIVGEVIATGRPVTTTDARADQRLAGAHSVHALALRSVMAVPLLGADGVLGALYLEDRLRPQAFGEADVARLTHLAALAVPSLEAAKLLQQERRTARRLSVAQARLARQVEAQALELHQLKRAQAQIASGVPHGIVGDSQPLQRALSLSARVAHSDVPVLILGESGTGKELFAKAIHNEGPRAGGPFVSENCSAIPEGLLESALFGHVRGAFTGAERPRQGLFEIADGGTLLLDEVGDMPAAMQVRLLRVLQDGMVRPVGGERARKVDVRVIGATHRDLEAMVRDGSFRQDLFYRLAVVQLRLPALRERPDDIGDLVAHFIERHAPGRDIRMDRRALSRLTQFHWPGNIRQLENEIRRALLLADGVISESHLSAEVLGEQVAPADDLDLKAQVGALERRLIARALRESGGNQTKAARTLGVSRYGLQKMIRRLEL